MGPAWGGVRVLRKAEVLAGFCTLKRQCGWARPVATAAAVFSASAGPSMELQEEALEIQGFRSLRDRHRLRIDQLQLLAARLRQKLRPLSELTHTSRSRPARRWCRWSRPPRSEKPCACSATIRAGSSWRRGSPPVQTTSRCSASPVQRAATAAARSSAVAKRPPPSPSMPRRNRCRAELAGGAGAVFFAPAPKVAAGKAAEHGSPPRLAALTLERQEDLLDRIAHDVRAGRPAAVHSEKPFARRAHAGQVPQPLPHACGVPIAQIAGVGVLQRDRHQRLAAETLGQRPGLGLGQIHQRRFDREGLVHAQVQRRLHRVHGLAPAGPDSPRNQGFRTCRRPGLAGPFGRLAPRHRSGTRCFARARTSMAGRAR